MPVTIDQVKKYAPIFHFHQDEKFYPCSIEYLLRNSVLRAADGSTITTNPSQADLTAGTTDGGATRYVDVDAGNYGGSFEGGQVTAPVYYALQDFADCSVIHYVLVYAYQGGQTCRGLRWGSEFNCIVNDFGIHQGDLERVAVVLSPDGSKVLAVQYEAHGDTKDFAPAMVNWVNDASGQHPSVHISLNAHSMHNLAREDNPVNEYEVPLVVRIVDECGDGVSWSPAQNSEFKQLSLVGGQPQGSELWAGFAGRLGKPQDNQLQSATYYDGSNLNSPDWTWVKMTDFMATLMDKYPGNLLHGNGPEGPAKRAWVSEPAADAEFFGAHITALWNSSDLGQGAGNVAMLKGRFYDRGKDSVLQFWSNDGNAAVIAYALDDQGVLSELPGSGDLGQGAGAFRWLKGRFLGSELEQAVQLWDNDGSLGLILYGIGNKDAMSCLWASENMGQGSGAVSWQVGDYNGDGRDEILQLWGNGDSLAMILYGFDEKSGTMIQLWATENAGQGPGAVAWRTADYNGDGKAELLQLWGNGGSLGMILYGWDGTGLAQLWATGDAGEGPGAVAWPVGDFNDDGKAELLQLWGNGSSLGMILYGWDGGSGLKKLWRTDDCGQGPGAVAWLVGDYDASGGDQLLQCWGNGSSLGMIIYGWDGSSGLKTLWGTDNMYEGPGAVAWFAGEFNGGGRSQVLQFWRNGSSMGAIEYGTLIQE